jgi:hypothetical protein
MSAEADIEQLRRGLAECFGTFAREEVQIRAELEGSRRVDPARPLELLERRTRRFLIDGILSALDWDVADPAVIREEARAASGAKDALFFDYLGLRTTDEAPVLIVEAKHADLAPPKPKWGTAKAPNPTAEHLSKELAIIKGGSGTSRSNAEWSSYLKDLRTYVGALGNVGRTTLRRVVITSGRWLIIFNDPDDAFIKEGIPDTSAILFFASTEEMQEGVERLYWTLHRKCLIDDLPLVVSVTDALKWMSGDRITSYLRAVFVATRRIGATIRDYPARVLYPALVLETESRWFVIVDSDARRFEELTDVDDISPMLQELQRRGDALEGRVRSLIGNAGSPGSLADFPGLPNPLSRGPFAPVILEAEPDSLVGRVARTASRKRLVYAKHDAGAGSEVVAVTGEEWFYKLDHPLGPACDFHGWREAKLAGVSVDDAPGQYSDISFTSNTQVRHCANGDHRAVRSRHCHLRVIETHLCCRSCVYQRECWDAKPAPTACPKVHLVLDQQQKD